MRYLFIASLLLLGFILSCNSPGEMKSNESTQEITIEVNKSYISEGVAKSIAQIGIEGMSCEVGCAKKIGKTLAMHEGVINADVLFEDKIAKVEYDDSRVTEEELIDIIHGLSHGQYEVTRVSVEKQVIQDHASGEAGTKEGALGKDATSALKDKKKVEEASEPIISFPDIFDAFTRLYRY